MTAIDIETDELFGAPLRQSPLVALRRTRCAVCGQTAEVAEGEPALCNLCGESLSATRARCEEMLALLHAGIDAHCTAWRAAQDALAEDVAERWGRLCVARDTARGAVIHAERGRIGWRVDRAALLEAARAKLAVVDSRIAATRAAGGPLADLLAKEAEYDAELLRLQLECRRWHIALQEVEAAAGELPL